MVFRYSQANKSKNIFDKNDSTACLAARVCFNGPPPDNSFTIRLMFWTVAVINTCSLINFNLRNFALLNPINSFASPNNSSIRFRIRCEIR